MEWEKGLGHDVVVVVVREDVVDAGGQGGQDAPKPTGITCAQLGNVVVKVAGRRKHLAGEGVTVNKGGNSNLNKGRKARHGAK